MRTKRKSPDSAEPKKEKTRKSKSQLPSNSASTSPASSQHTSPPDAREKRHVAPPRDERREWRESCSIELLRRECEEHGDDKLHCPKCGETVNDV